MHRLTARRFGFTGFAADDVQKALLVGVCLAASIFPTQAQEPKVDLGSLSLDSLSSIEITSVSRKEQKLSEAASAIYVISSEDIRRSGMTNIAELLRMAPGIDVAEIDANKWSITARGFAERYPDKMLVLLDGRTLYSPLTSGVSWDVQETMLEDIDRIEVIRGPGATLWGANAVNGVVNIITKSSKDTPGALVSGGGGIQDRDSGAARYGGTIGSKGSYRVFGKYFNRRGLAQAGSGSPADGWHDERGGLRSDWTPTSDTTLTVQGDIYRGRVGTTVPGIIAFFPPLSGLFIDKAINSGGDLIGRWSKFTNHLETTAKAYLDLANRNEIGVLGEFRHTIDLDFIERYHAGGRHDFLWGGDFRDNSDRTVGSLNISFNPASRSTQLYGVFIQDEVALLPTSFKLTVGAKLEHNYYSGFALQPNSRMIWIPTQRSSTWIAISRASENSSRTDADVRTNEDPEINASGVLTISSSFGTLHLPPEDVAAYELGSRFQATRGLGFDIASFYNHYTNRHTDEPGTPYFEDTPLPRHLVLPAYTQSNISGETHGLEFLALAHPAGNWAISGSYMLFEIHLHQSPSSQDFETAPDSEDSSPRHKAQIRSLLTLPHHLEFDSSVYYVAQLAGPGIPAYTRLDLRAGWRPNPSTTISGGGRNLLQHRHYEFTSGELVQAEPIARSFYIDATWSF